MGPTDEELVSAFQHGDAAAFDELVSRWDRKIHGAIYRVVGADEDSRDLCQEADEFVVVAVDFVPRMADRAGSRTVVARARKRDLVDHRAGRLSADALQARVDFDEY